MKLNLGCSDDLLAGYVNVDRIDAPGVLYADLNRIWPWHAGEVEEIRAHDVFEHLHGPGTVAPKIWCMNEAHSVLKTGGILELYVPCVMLSDGRVNPGAFADPTHVSFWTMDDQYYFCSQWHAPDAERGRLGPAYGITALFDKLLWNLAEYGDAGNRRAKIQARLRAVK